MLVKIKKGLWVNSEDLTDAEKIKFGLKVEKVENDIDEAKILKELKETPEEVKKSPVKKRKED